MKESLQTWEGMVVNTERGGLPEKVSAYLREIRDDSKHRRVEFAPAKWRKWLGSVEGLSLDLDAFGGLISRSEMVWLVDKSLARGRAGVADAFVVTMLWGHGDSGYGSYRTREILTQGGTSVGAEVIDSLHSSVQAIRSGAYDGFCFLNNVHNKDGGPAGKIAGLGPAFFTKWMYVVSAQGSPSGLHALPIFDDVLRRAVKPFWGGGRPPRYGYTGDYVEYVEALRHWGESERASAAQVEEAIFDVVQGYQHLERFEPRKLDRVFR